MRLWVRALLFWLLTIASFAGVALGATARPIDSPLIAVSSLAFFVGILGLAAVGFVYVYRRIRFGRQKTYGQPALTSRGEVVRSHAERTIADYFARNEINYVYEKPAMNRWGSRRISRPDFYLPDYRVHVEYWGLVDLPDGAVRQRYERNMRWKMAQYHRNGIKLVSLYPSDLHDLDANFRYKLERASGKAAQSVSGRRFCGSCGRQLSQTDRFCTGCGKAF